jgi:hypothetical protein
LAEIEPAELSRPSDGRTTVIVAPTIGKMAKSMVKTPKIAIANPFPTVAGQKETVWAGTIPVAGFI